MSRLCARVIAMSLDGFVAGRDQSLDAPLGVGGEELHKWVFDTMSGRQMIGEAGGETGVDNGFIARAFDGIGASVMGRNMFGPIRGPWSTPEGEAWRGWWGDEPPYHHPVFVLTHYPHDPIAMDGGTTFHFVTDGIEAALERAVAAAGGKDVRLGGGAETIREYMRAGLLDNLHLSITPVLLGAGERIFDDLGEATNQYECVDVVAGERVTHVMLARR